MDPKYHIPYTVTVDDPYPSAIRWTDLNTDGLMYIVEVRGSYDLYGTLDIHQRIWLNKGDGTGWEQQMN